MAKSTIAVIGAGGKVGAHLTRLLLERGHSVRAIGRTAERLLPLVQLGAEARLGTVEDQRFLATAFRNADAVFVMIPPSYANADPPTYQRRVAEAVAEALQEARVRHVVCLSSIGAERAEGNGPIAGLHRLEERLNQIPGLNVVHLRAGYFMENLLAGILMIRNSGINGGAFRADLPLAMIATRDVAAAAVDLLADRQFTGHTARELHGPRALTFREATTILGSAIGKPDLTYVEYAYPDTRGALLATGSSPVMADLFIEMIDAFNRGVIGARESPTTAITTPTTLEEFARTVFAPAFERH